ncbi:MAG: hypothetical protein ACRDNX_01765 [Gaiellaceae bacterium]
MTRHKVVAGVLAGLLAPASALGVSPADRVLVPGRTFDGLELGATRDDVKARWGSRFGECRNCSSRTWYFNQERFEPQGMGVEFRDGRAASYFTLWQPRGWKTSRGLALGEHVARVTAVYGPLTRTECGTYSALTLPRGRTVTAFYVVDGRLWGFGLSRRGLPVCR